jgi:hypothetical protein
VTDKLPKMVCEECAYKLDLLFEFREKSVKTETYLENVLKTIEPQQPPVPSLLLPPPLPPVQVRTLYTVISGLSSNTTKGQVQIFFPPF